MLRLALITCWLLMPTAAVAQGPGPDADNAAAAPCPFPTPRLTSSNPAEVAWAAAALTPAACRTPQVATDLITALRSMRDGKTEGHQRAVLHLLHAANLYELRIPMAELRFEPPADARLPWLVLQVRAATKDGRDLFALFHNLDEATDLGWELVGNELAARGNAMFAVELRTTMRPRLRVIAGAAKTIQGLMTQILQVAMIDRPAGELGWPAAPIYSWDRTTAGVLYARAYTSNYWVPNAVVADESSRDRAKLRWLGEVAGESVNWANHFVVSYPRQDLKSFPAVALRAEQKAREVLAAIDERLRADFKLPASLKLPELEVAWEDERPEELQTKFPMPPMPARK